MKARRGQCILITHSPYLIPTNREEDLYRIIRFYLQDGATKVAGLQWGAYNQPPIREMAKWIEEMRRATDVPALLFARGVILVEGETEAGALPIWFAKSQICRDKGSLEDRNLVMHLVGGDKNFGTYVKFLKAFAIPWVIFCDGKVIGERRIFNQIGVDTSGLRVDLSFQELTEFSKKHGVFTLAQNSKQEFEKLPYVQPHLEEAEQEVGNSKVRQGCYIAHTVECPEEVNSLYLEILKYFGEIRETT